MALTPAHDRLQTQGALMRNMTKILAAAALCATIGGCAGTIPVTPYTPQNGMRYDYRNSVDMAAFTYIPALSGRVRENQIENTAAGNFYISTGVAEMVKRITALELEKSGLRLTDAADLAVGGDVLELKAADIGFSVDWTYAVRYKIFQGRKEIFSREYSPPMKNTTKFGSREQYAAWVHAAVLSGYDMFIRDPAVQRLLDVPPLQKK